MTRQIITTPTNFLRLSTVEWDIDWRGQSTSEFNSGITRTVHRGFPRWIGNSSFSLYRSDIAIWNAIRDTAQGRWGMYKIRMVDVASFNLYDVGTTTEIEQGKQTDEGNYFSNGYGTEYEPFALADAAASAGADEIRVDTTSCGGLVPAQGQIMSHNWWPFRVSWVRPVSGNVYRLGVQMPLREAIADGQVILMRGVGLFEAAEEATGVAGYGTDRFTRAQMRLVEVIGR